MALEKVEIVLAVNRMGFNESFPANCWQQMAGIWSQVQQNQFIALEASLGGQNLVHGPCEITPTGPEFWLQWEKRKMPVRNQ